jgi:hypothetical protein
VIYISTAFVAQWIRHRPPKPGIEGSSPFEGNITFLGVHINASLFLSFVRSLNDTKIFRALLRLTLCIRALSAHSAAKFNISPGRWQHVWLVAIVSPERWGEIDRNDCHTAWGNLKTLIYLIHHYNKLCLFFFINWFFFIFFSYLFTLYRHLPAASHNFFNASGSGTEHKLRSLCTEQHHKQMNVSFIACLCAAMKAWINI